MQTFRGHNATQSRSIEGSPVGMSTVEGTLVYYRQPVEGRVKWSLSGSNFESTVRMCHRLALVLDDHSLWFTSHVVECMEKLGGGWTVRTENSVYQVGLVVLPQHSKPPRDVSAKTPRSGTAS